MVVDYPTVVFTFYPVGSTTAKTSLTLVKNYTGRNLQNQYIRVDGAMNRAQELEARARAAAHFTAGNYDYKIEFKK